MVTPELLDKGIENLELRLRGTGSSAGTDFGERPNDAVSGCSRFVGTAIASHADRAEAQAPALRKSRDQ